MKFTQISTLALAAMMAFSSCSKEEVMNPGEADLLPGEARIVLDLGRKGATTYSTKVAETAIKNGGVKLFYKSGENAGKEITMTGVRVSTDGKVVATVPAAAAATKADAIMYVYLNAASVANGAGTPADKSAKSLHATGTVATKINRDLKDGAPAGLSTDVTLAPGTIPVTAPKAKRAIARVGATNMSKETSIAGFKIAFDGVNLTKGAIYDGSVTDGALEALVYPLVKSGLDIDPDTYSENETVAYMYPSKEVTVTITPPVGEPKDVKFTPAANMNYTIKITPKKPATDAGNIAFTVSIEGTWDEGKDMNVDFNGDAKMKVQPDFTSGSASLKSGVLEITTDGKKTVEMDLKSLVGDVTAFYNEFGANAELKTRATANFITSINETTHKLTITYPAVYNASPLEAVLTISANHSSNAGDPERLDIPLKVIGKALPAGFLVDMGGVVFPALNSSGSIDGDIALFNKINAQGTGTFAQKYISYIKISNANFVDATSKKFADAATARTAGCPVGFKVPSFADYKVLLQNTFNYASSAFTTSNPTQYNVGAIGVLESITDGARKEVTSDRKVGVFTTGLSGGDQANKAYRLFEYKGAQLVFTVTSASTIYGGLYTTDGNVGMNGSGTSPTVYTETNGITPNMQIRCIKDDAANVIW